MLGRRAKKAKRKRKRVTVVETDELGAGAQVHGAQSLAHGQAQILAQAQGHGIEVLDQALHRAQAQARELPLESAEIDLLLTLLRQRRWVHAVGVHVVTLVHIVNRLRA